MINVNEKRPKAAAYLELYSKIKDEILKGVYPNGSKLPSKRTVADMNGVSVITAKHAYELLCDEGYVEPRERSGFFVIFSPSDGFSLPSRYNTLPYTRHQSEASPSQFPFSVLSKTIRRVLTEYGEGILEKSPNLGCIELREAIRTYLERNRGIKAEAEQIVIGAGAEYLYGLIVELLGTDMGYAIESPSYEKIEKVYQASGAACRLLPLGADGIESNSLSATDAAVLHITPYRSFPTGISASASKRYEYLRWASRSGRIIVEDDFESEFSISSKPAETLFSLSEYDNVIYMNTFSMTVSPSLRIGYMVLPRSLTSLFERKLGFYSCTVSTFEQLILSELIRGGDFERHINRVRRRKRKASSEVN